MLRKKFVISEVANSFMPVYLTAEGKPLFQHFRYQGRKYHFSQDIASSCKWIDYNEAEAFLIGFSEQAEPIYPIAMYIIVTIYERTN